jgi:hypothetical protein
MEKCRERSQFSKGKLVWMGLSILVLVIWAGIEVMAYWAGKPSFLGIAYIVLFAALLFWRYGISYVYILTDQELTIISEMLFFTRKFTLTLNAVESYSDKYVRSFLFTGTGMNRFVHRHSSGDASMMRMVVFAQHGKSSAVLFKVSDRFMKELKAVIPKG